MAYTAADLTALEAALAAGVLRAKYPDGSEITYQSTADMIRLRSLMQGEINAASATPTPRMTRVVHSRV